MVQSRYCGNNLETNAGGQAEMFRNVVRGDTRIFSPLAVARLCVTIGHCWYLFKRLTAVSAGRFYRFEHIVTYSSGKVVAKSAPSLVVHKIAKDSAAIGKLYGCKSTCGDNYAGEWPRETFLEHGIVCESVRAW